jgi:hypothetical protein
VDHHGGGGQQQTAAAAVKHYRIRTLDNNAGFFITTRAKFVSLRELVTYYSGIPNF